MEFNWIFRCPSCEGPIARWFVREKLACPSCNAALKSNTRKAARNSIFVGFLVGLFVWVLFGIYTGAWLASLFGAGGEAGVFFGFIVGNVFFRYSLSMSVVGGSENAL